MLNRPIQLEEALGCPCRSGNVPPASGGRHPDALPFPPGLSLLLKGSLAADGGFLLPHLLREALNGGHQVKGGRGGGR